MGDEFYWDEGYLTLFYKVVIMMEDQYDVDDLCYEDCAAIADEVVTAAWDEYYKEFPNSGDINTLAIAELDKRLEKKKEG